MLPTVSPESSAAARGGSFRIGLQASAGLSEGREAKAATSSAGSSRKPIVLAAAWLCCPFDVFGVSPMNLTRRGSDISWALPPADCGVANPRRKSVCLAFFRVFSSPSGHKWQRLHWRPFWQPPSFQNQPHGWQAPDACRADPSLGRSRHDTTASAPWSSSDSSSSSERTAAAAATAAATAACEERSAGMLRRRTASGSIGGAEGWRSGEPPCGRAPKWEPKPNSLWSCGASDCFGVVSPSWRMVSRASLQARHPRSDGMVGC
mmetsp:Transcript_93122/g.260119  ORF Transcript_93122/g.260119 Transcript_93122/m.260119 type:complete len:263 (-) Transcript_93122:126-914(-)